MITYRDMTFCSNGDTCDMAGRCKRDMTPNDALWALKSGIPVSVAAFYKEGVECEHFMPRQVSYMEVTQRDPH